MIKKLLFLGLLALTHGIGIAQQNATPVNGDTRLVTFEYDPDQTYLILTRPRAVTHIQLRPDEKVNTAVAGDTANFTVVVSTNRNNILIRPKYEGMTTSLTLITSERNYPIMLRSTAEVTGKWYQRVTWNFQDMMIDDLAQQEIPVGKANVGRGQPSDELIGLQPSGVALDKLATNYEIEGDADFRPANVFDDGIRTYIRFPENLQNIPAIFAIFEGEAKLVNYTIDQRHIVIQGVHNELLIKMGKTTVRVNKIIKRGFWSSIGG